MSETRVSPQYKKAVEAVKKVFIDNAELLEENAEKFFLDLTVASLLHDKTVLSIGFNSGLKTITEFKG